MSDHRDDEATGDRAEEPTPEELRHRELLADIYGPDVTSSPLYPDIRAGLARLDRLRRTDPLLDFGPLDLDAAVPADTHLSPTTVTAGANPFTPPGPPPPPEPDPTTALVTPTAEPDPPPPDAPRLDPAMAPPPRRRTPARFADGRQMPAYVDDLQSLLPSRLTATEIEQLLTNPGTFGQSTVVLRGSEQALDAIDRALGAGRTPGPRTAHGCWPTSGRRSGTSRRRWRTARGARSRTPTRTERRASCGSERVTTATGPRSTTASVTRRRSTACTGRPRPSG